MITPKLVFTPEAIRAARALLGWGVRDLAAAAGVSWTTVSRYETGASASMHRISAEKVLAALTAAGVQVIDAPDRTGAVLFIEAANGNAPK